MTSQGTPSTGRHVHVVCPNCRQRGMIRSQDVATWFRCRQCDNYFRHPSNGRAVAPPGSGRSDRGRVEGSAATTIACKLPSSGDRDRRPDLKSEGREDRAVSTPLQAEPSSAPVEARPAKPSPPPGPGGDDPDDTAYGAGPSTILPTSPRLDDDRPRGESWQDRGRSACGAGIEEESRAREQPNGTSDPRPVAARDVPPAARADGRGSIQRELEALRAERDHLWKALQRLGRRLEAAPNEEQVEALTRALEAARVERDRSEDERRRLEVEGRELRERIRAMERREAERGDVDEDPSCPVWVLGGDDSDVVPSTYSGRELGRVSRLPTRDAGRSSPAETEGRPSPDAEPTVVADESRIAALREELESTRRELESARREAESLRSQLEARESILGAEADRAKREAEEWRRSAEALGLERDRQVSALGEEIDRLRREIQAGSEERRAREDAARAAEATVASRTAALMAEVDRLWAEVDSALADAQAAKAGRDEMRQGRDEAERACREWQAEAERLRLDRDGGRAADDRLRALQAEAEAARREAEEARRRRDEEVDAIRSSREEDARQVATLRAELERLRGQSEAARSAEESARAECAGHLAARREAEGGRRAARAEAERLRGELEAIAAVRRDETEALRAEYEAARREAERRHQAEVDRLLERLDRAGRDEPARPAETTPDPFVGPGPADAAREIATATAEVEAPARIEAVPSAAPRPRGLSNGHFRRIATNGFGDGRNSYAWSSAWFDDHLYIGTIRHVLVTLSKRVAFDAVWPVPLPKADEELDVRAQIWRYSFDQDRWDRIYRSPMVPGLEGKMTPLATGFRNMSVFQGKSDSRPVIYTIPSCNRYHGLGPVLLRSEDGLNFEVASEHGLGIGDPNVITFRGNLPFKGRLFISPSGSRGGHCNTSFNAVILCSDDPSSGHWEVSNPPSFGDPNNQGIFDLGICGGYLYAGTINVREGCQLWRTDAEGPPPHRWEKVADHGFDRGPHNQAIVCFSEFQGDLYLGTGIQNGGFDRINNVGPAAGEVIRVHPDGSWDLVMGQPRMSRQGLKIPASGLGPGFDNPLAGYIWRMRTHDGALYVGTYDMSSTLPFSGSDQWPEWLQRLITPEELDRYMEFRGGCEVWRSTDGDNWVAVTRNGFDNPYNWGVRTLFSTPRGLIVGTANPFGPQVAVKGPAGWRYEDNPRGGLEIWHGAPENAGIADPAERPGVHPGADPWFGDDNAIPCELLLSRTDDPASCTGPGDQDAGPPGFLDDLIDRMIPDDLIDRHRRHAMPEVEAHRDSSRRDDPVRRLAEAEKDLVGLGVDVEGELAEYYGGSEMRNVGYWRDKATTPREACEQLLEELFALSPSPEPGSPPPAILVAGSGVAGTAARLLRRFPEARVTALLDDGHAAGPRPADPRVGILPAAADRLGVPDDSFDLVVWVEGPGIAARPMAAREVRRVLRPGGRLLATDVVGSPAAQAHLPLRAGGTEALLGDYRKALEQAGLGDVRVADATRETWARSYRHSSSFFGTKLLFQQLDKDQFRRILDALPGGHLVVEAYLMATAVRPLDDTGPGAA